MDSWRAINKTEGLGVRPVGRTRSSCGLGFAVVVVHGLPIDRCLVSDDGASAPRVVPELDPVTDRDADSGAGMERNVSPAAVGSLGRVWAAPGPQGE